MIEELIARVFAARNAAHLEHWRTKSIAAHEALGEFYDAIISHLEEDLVWINKNRKAITSSLPAIDNLLQGLEGDYMHVLYKLKRLS